MPASCAHVVHGRAESRPWTPPPPRAVRQPRKDSSQGYGHPPPLTPPVAVSRAYLILRVACVSAGDDTPLPRVSESVTSASRTCCTVWPRWVHHTRPVTVTRAYLISVTAAGLVAASRDSHGSWGRDLTVADSPPA